MNSTTNTFDRGRVLHGFFVKLAMSLALLGFLASATPLGAARADGKGWGDRSMEREARHELRAERMADRLGLEGERRQAFAEALRAAHDERMAAARSHRENRGEGRMARVERQEAMAQSREGLRKTFEEILSEEELAKFDALRTRRAHRGEKGMEPRRERAMERKGNRSGSGPAR